MNILLARQTPAPSRQRADAAAAQYTQSSRPRRARAHLIATMAAAAGDASASPPPAVVSPEWLAARLRERPGSVRVLDASWYLPAMGRDAAAEFRAARIPGARFFDTDGVALAGTDLPHMLPPERAFAAAMDALGVADPSSGEEGNGGGGGGAGDGAARRHVVAYDGLGTFASPRLWWALRAMGHDKVSVLSGGLPAWRAAGLPVEEGWPPAGQQQKGEEEGPIDGGAAAAAQAAQRQQQGAEGGGAAPRYRANLRPEAVWSFEQMLEAAAAAAAPGPGKEGGGNKAPPPLILDARPAGRFRGADPEPRAHLRRGHVPGSLNVPFPTLLEGGQDGGLSGARLKPAEALRGVFSQAGVDLDSQEGGAPPPRVVCSCGSGLTACIVALALHEATGGKVDAAVYDGSWCEWGARDDTPIDNPSAAGSGGGGA